MATGRIGVTPTLRTRWSDQPTAGTTSLSGLDDNSVALVYDVGYEAVYRNGVLLSRGNDYTATDGTTVTLTEATIAGDIIEIFANQLVPLTDAISKGQYTAKGALLSATAASTPGVLTVGSNDQVLTADSTTATGLKWAAAASGGDNWTLLNSGGTSLSGTTTTVSGISGKNKLMILVEGASTNTGQATIAVRINGDTGYNYKPFGINIANPSSYAATYLDNHTPNWQWIRLGMMTTNTSSSISGYVHITGCNSSGVKVFTSAAAPAPASGNTGEAYISGGFWPTADTISSISVASGNTFDGGTVYVYASA